MRIASGLRAISLATIIAIVGVSAVTAPAAATDPAPTPTPEATESPSCGPGPDASPEPTPEASYEPTPEPTGSAAPTPESTPEPTAESTAIASPEPSTDPDPATSPAPTPEPTASTLAAAVATPTAKPNLGVRIVRIALAQRGKRYRPGAIGPRAFDCSGLVRFAYRKAGISYRLGGGHSARGMLRWGRNHGLTSRHNPRVGDVVIYGNGTHAAIYIGRGRVISALNPRQGIRITKLHALSSGFTTFIHTRK